jgi:ATP-dependent DNA helicase PIF1
VDAILKNPKLKRKWKTTRILIVDEISMMTPELFEKLDAIAKRVRNSAEPFGGIQLVLCGDFFQLPPVVRGISGECLGRFAFESALWAKSQLEPVLLKRIERQTDVDFQTLLNECRIGLPSEASISLLKRRQGLDWKSRLIKPTVLFSKNTDVDSINEKNIHALNKPLKPFVAKTEIRITSDLDPSQIPTGDTLLRFVQRLDNDSNYAQNLTLCVGCQVMLLVNKDMSQGLVNGSRGIVVDFRYDGVPIVQFLQGEPIAIPMHEWASNDCPFLLRLQIPLRVAYALTIHKSQGATLDCALIDIGKNTFECGQAYVALSRVRSLDSLYVWNLEPSKINAHSAVVKFYESLEAH